MDYKWKRNTAIFLSSQAVSTFGSSLVQFAITSYITVQTKSGIYATISILCAILPMFILSPFAGVWADKYNRKTLIMAADGGIAFCTLIVAILFLSGHGSIPLLCVALAIRSFGSAIQQPCISALLPDIVLPEHLTRINGINSSMQSLFQLASPVLGAMLLSMMPLGTIFFIDIATALIAILIMLTAFYLPVKDRPAKDHVSGNYFVEMKLGIKYVLKTKFLTQFFSFSTIFFLMMAPAVFLTQVQVVRNYGEGYWYLTAIEVAFSLGMLISGIIITLWGGLKNKVYAICLSGAAMGAVTIALGIPMAFPPYVILMGLFGLSLPVLSTAATTLLQEKVESQYMGRVFGIMTMINTSMMPLGMIIFGPMADKIAIETILIGTGIATILTSLSMTRAKALCRAGRS